MNSPSQPSQAGRDDLPFPTGPTIHELVVITGDRALLDIHSTSRIDSLTKLEIGTGMFIGKYVHIASLCHLGVGGGSLKIFEGATISSSVKLLTGTSRISYGRSASAAHPDFEADRGNLIIGVLATVLAGATVNPGCHIGINAVVGAGSVVTRPVPAYQVWVGNPARFLKWVPGTPASLTGDFE